MVQPSTGLFSFFAVWISLGSPNNSLALTWVAKSPRVLSSDVKAFFVDFSGAPRLIVRIVESGALIVGFKSNFKWKLAWLVSLGTVVRK